MSGKYAKKKRRNKSRRNRPILIAIVVLSVLLAVLLLFAFGLEHDQNKANQDHDNTETQNMETSAPVVTEPTQSAEEDVTIPSESEEQYLFDLGNGIKIVGLVSYTGAFMEDRTDEVVTDVLGIQVKNSGEQYIQTMDITLIAGETEAQFSLSTLFPGETVVLLEKNRMAYSSAPEFDQVKTDMAAMFREIPGMCEDKLKIQCMDGVINVSNISGEDITGDILIYYKNYVGGMYYGGLTYRLRIEGGLKAGEIRQGSAAHFNPDNSKVVFVTCG